MAQKENFGQEKGGKWKGEAIKEIYVEAVAKQQSTCEAGCLAVPSWKKGTDTEARRQRQTDILTEVLILVNEGK